MEELIDKHSIETGTFMPDTQSIVNFIDHISPMGDDCDICRRAIQHYTDGDLTIVVGEKL